MNVPSLSIVIPTYGREQVLVDSIRLLLVHQVPILLVDQTPTHDQSTLKQLESWQREGCVQHLHLKDPSIPQAMNTGLLAAKSEIVLFLDDDIEPHVGLVKAHVEAHQRHPEGWAVVGQVLQPGEVPKSRGDWFSREGILADLDFPYWSDESAWVRNVMAGNLSVKREHALAIGGFDENYEGVAYRFETEFARRLIRAGGKIYYEPNASIKHLRAERGGTRSTGSHLTSMSPKHGQGDYYFALQSGYSLQTLWYIVKRPFREVCTKFHLKHPWYIPIKFIGELRAMWAGFGMFLKGPKYLQVEKRETL